MTAALVLFSAGQDSATALAWALERYDRVETIGFDYGQRHRVELTQRPPLLAAIGSVKPAWRARLGGDRVVDMGGFGALAESALTGAGPIEERAEGLPTSFVPGRNLAFFAFAGARARVTGASVLVGGMCETDFSGYPDCRHDAIQAMAEALRLGLEAPMAIETPLMRLTKGETWDLAASLGGPALVEAILEHSHTCYEGVRAERYAWGYGCGACPACRLRAAGWADHEARARRP